MTEFQASSSRQGRQFADQCDELLRNYGFTLAGRLLLPDVGVEVDRVATSPNGTELWLEYKGSMQVALRAGYLDDVICLYRPADTARLRAL